MDSKDLNATIEERTPVHDGYAILRVRPDALSDVGPPRMRIAKRSYSIASSARDTDHYELFVALVTDGRLTPQLWTIPAGGRCWIGDRAHGEFTLERVPADRDLVMVATG